MFLLAFESGGFSPFILEVPFGVNCRAERFANKGLSSTGSFHFTFLRVRSASVFAKASTRQAAQSPTLRSGPRFFNPQSAV